MQGKCIQIICYSSLNSKNIGSLKTSRILLFLSKGLAWNGQDGSLDWGGWGSDLDFSLNHLVGRSLFPQFIDNGICCVMYKIFIHSRLHSKSITLP
jgi:hypothetical protein